jgi:hypothetical protein
MVSLSTQVNPKLSIEELNRMFLKALEGFVASHSDVTVKPLEVDLLGQLPPKLRVYLYNATYPPGGRGMGEHKIQLIVPGQARSERGNFDSSGGRIPLLVGYRPDIKVFVLWDAEMYPDFAYSRNVQVLPETIYKAFAQGLGRQIRRLGSGLEEVVIAAEECRLGDAILERQNETLKRLFGAQG